MKRNAIVIGAVVLVLAAAVLLVIWLNKEEPVEKASREGVAGPPPAPAAPQPGPAEPQPVVAAPPPAGPSADEPLSASVLFEFDRAALREAEAAKLDRLLERLKAKGLKRLDAEGHADRIGPAAYNMKLSQRRADAVKAYLLGKEVDPAAVNTSAKGELDSVTGDACLGMGPATRRNAALVECLQPDRRVEVTVAGGT